MVNFQDIKDAVSPTKKKNWRDELKPASFRDVPFEVDSDDMGVGRRNQTHEYPGRDTPYTEDLGRAARELTVEAFVIGEDFMEKRDKLLAAIEQGGSGVLIHPWYGSMKMDVSGKCRVRHGWRDGRYCAISISFVESGQLESPTAVTDTKKQTQLAADAANAALKNEFPKFFQVGGLPSFVLDDALSGLNEYMSALEAGMANITVISKIALNVLRGDFSDLIPNAYSLANRIVGLFNQADALAVAFATGADSGSVSVAGVPAGTGPYSLSALEAEAINLTRTLAVIDAVSKFPQIATSAETPASQQVETNTNAIATLISGALLVQASGMVSEMNLPVYEDAAALQTKLLRALDEHCRRVRTDEAYEAFSDLRHAVSKHMANKMRDSARLITYTPRKVMPALVLAYELYGDPGRADEIVARNKISHPGFVPAEPLLVLSK